MSQELSADELRNQQFMNQVIRIQNELQEIQDNIDKIPPDIDTFTVNQTNQSNKLRLDKQKENLFNLSVEMNSLSKQVYLKEQIQLVENVASKFVCLVQKLHDRELKNQYQRRLAIRQLLQLNDICMDYEIDEELVTQKLLSGEIQDIQREVLNASQTRIDSYKCQDISKEILDATLTTLTLEIQQGQYLEKCSQNVAESVVMVQEANENHAKAMKSNKIKKQVIKIGIILIIILILLLGICSMVIKASGE